MPHTRARLALPRIKKLAALWPIVGVIGPRQCGKTTLVGTLLGLSNSVSLDDQELRQMAIQSPKLFLSRLEKPVIIDEVQKAPPLFDALKLEVDQKRIPGRYFLTGSTSFSAKIGIRESLTGRMGLLQLTPMTLAELHSKPFIAIKDLAKPFAVNPKPRFDLSLVSKAMVTGGMPVPAFLRSEDQRIMYWQSWFETTIHRDLPRLFKRNYDPDLAINIINRMATVMKEGELPSLKHFAQSARIVRQYLLAMEDIFLVKKISCHPLGMGKEVWLFFDSGLLAYLMGTISGEAQMLSLARHFLWNEWFNLAQVQGLPFEKLYYKTAHGQPVDAILGGVPFRVVASTPGMTSQAAWESRSLLGAMKKLGAKFGYLIGPTDRVVLPDKKGGIGILPWGLWC